MEAIETTGIINEKGEIILKEPLSVRNKNVRVILLLESDLNSIDKTKAPQYDNFISDTDFTSDIEEKIEELKKLDKESYDSLKQELYEWFQYDIFYIEEDNYDVVFPIENIEDNELAFLSIWKEQQDTFLEEIEKAAMKSLKFFYEYDENRDYTVGQINFTIPNRDTQKWEVMFDESEGYAIVHVMLEGWKITGAPITH